MNNEQKGHKNCYVEEPHVWSYSLFAESPCDQFPKQSKNVSSENHCSAPGRKKKKILNPTFH